MPAHSVPTIGRLTCSPCTLLPTFSCPHLHDININDADDNQRAIHTCSENVHVLRCFVVDRSRSHELYTILLDPVIEIVACLSRDRSRQHVVYACFGPSQHPPRRGCCHNGMGCKLDRVHHHDRHHLHLAPAQGPRGKTCSNTAWRVRGKKTP